MPIGTPSIEQNLASYNERSVVSAFLNDIWGKPKRIFGVQITKGSQAAQIIEVTKSEVSGFVAETETDKAELLYREIQVAYRELQEARRRNTINLAGEVVDFLPVVAFGVNMIISPFTAGTSLYSALHKYKVLNPQLRKIGALVAEHFPETVQEDTSFSKIQEAVEVIETVLEFIPVWGRFTFVMTLFEMYLSLKFRKELVETHVELYRMADAVHKKTQGDLTGLQGDIG